MLQSRPFTEQAYFLGVRDPHAGVRMGDCAVRNDERNRVSQVGKRSGGDDCLLYISEN